MRRMLVNSELLYEVRHKKRFSDKIVDCPASTKCREFSTPRGLIPYSTFVACNTPGFLSSSQGVLNVAFTVLS